MEKNLLTDQRIFYKLNLAQRRLLKYADRESINRIGVPTAQSAALFYLMKHDGCLIKDLSNALPQNKSATTTLVERMQKNGLVVKKKAMTDGRAFNLFLTEKGREKSSEALKLADEYNQDLGGRFTESEMNVIHHFLDIIIENYR